MVPRGTLPRVQHPDPFRPKQTSRRCQARVDLFGAKLRSPGRLYRREDLSISENYLTHLPAGGQKYGRDYDITGPSAPVYIRP